jgi:drug/metabolite transporter (DMT)-like permease
MTATTGARLSILAGAALFSTGGVAIKLSHMSGWQIAGFRCAAAALCLLVLLPATRRGFTWRTILVGVPYAATLILYTLANKATTAANAIFLQDTAPLYLLLLAPWLLRERVTRADLLFLAALILGAALIFAAVSQPLASAPRPGLGNVLGIASGISWAFALLGMRWIAAHPLHAQEHPLTAIVAACGFAFVFCAFNAFPVEAVRAVDWLLVTYLGLFQIGLAYFFIARGMRHVPALESSLLLLIEPVFTPVWAWLLLAEVPPALALLGGGVILAATAVHALAGRGRRASPGGATSGP